MYVYWTVSEFGNSINENDRSNNFKKGFQQQLQIGSKFQQVDWSIVSQQSLNRLNKMAFQCGTMLLDLKEP